LEHAADPTVSDPVGLLLLRLSVHGDGQKHKER
jgi:hypothetical protein